MRIGVDAHIVLPRHKRYDPKIARYTEQLILHLLEADKGQKHQWVLFFDDRMKSTRKYERSNVEVKRFPFVQYRRYLPVVYSHMMVSAFLARAKLDVFHSPEGLIPFMYRGKTVTTFHYVPKGGSESNMFVRTFMLGARVAFAKLCQRADCIIVNSRGDKRLLVDKHKCGPSQVVVMENEDLERVDWSRRVRELMALYGRLTRQRRKVGVKKKERKKQKVGGRRAKGRRKE